MRFPTTKKLNILLLLLLLTMSLWQLIRANDVDGRMHIVFIRLLHSEIIELMYL